MARIQGILAALLAALIFVVPTGVLVAADASQAEIDQLKKDIEQLRKQLQGSSNAPMARSSVDQALAGKYGPNASVTTKSGKLTIGGLLQVWYYHPQSDPRAIFDSSENGGAINDTNTASDNATFRIRRAELSFTMDIHENVTAKVMIDPAAEANSFPGVPSNQGNYGPGNTNLFKVAPNVSPEFNAAAGGGVGGGTDVGSTGLVSNLQQGSGTVPMMLLDAYINYHGVIPHHDFTVGQFCPKIGEEGPRSDAELEFAERSMIGQLANSRDLGMQLHGCWWDDRFHYWLGGFDAAGGYFQTDANRADTNSDKDFLAATMIRPIWKSETWGSLELGMSFEGGNHGKSEFVGRDPTANPLNDVNMENTFARRWAAWGSYRPGGPVKGWWFRGEWQAIHDRPQLVTDPSGAGVSPIYNLATPGYSTTLTKPFSVSGFYISTGYKFGDSCLCGDSGPSFLKGFEVVARYEQLQNVWTINPCSVEDPVSDVSVYNTKVVTGGFNYYIKGHNAKIQVDYNFVSNPHKDGWHQTDNNNLVVNFQVAF